MKKSSKQKVLTALENGGITSREIQNRCKVVNPRDVIYNLRKEYTNIVTVDYKTRDGAVIGRYELV